MRLEIVTAILGVALAASGRPAQAEFSVRDYCEVTLRAREIAELEWKDRISVAQLHQGPSAVLESKLRSLDPQYERLKGRLYAHYGTTFQDYLRYGASHRAAIRLYLEQDPDMRGALDASSRRVQSLRQHMESVMSARHAAEERK
jgi:hypothetical protein